MALTSGLSEMTLGTVTVKTPYSMLALTWSILAFSGSLNLLRNWPLDLSTRCHVSLLASTSFLLSLHLFARRYLLQSPPSLHLSSALEDRPWRCELPGSPSSLCECWQALSFQWKGQTGELRVRGWRMEGLEMDPICLETMGQKCCLFGQRNRLESETFRSTLMRAFVRVFGCQGNGFSWVFIYRNEKVFIRIEHLLID